mgnify:FL=1
MWLALAGVLFGIIGGMGMGGGIVLIPVLTLLFGMSQHQAQGLNLLTFFPMAVFAIIAHLRKKRIDVKTALLMALVGAAGAAGGAWLCSVIEGEVLRRIFGGFLILLGIIRTVELIRSVRNRKKGLASGEKKA